MRRVGLADAIDGRLLLALKGAPRATALALAEHTGLSRNTVQARIAKLEQSATLYSFERRVNPAALGYPVHAFVLTNVRQRRLDSVADALAEVPEVIEVHGLSGVADLLIHVVARNVEDLYRVAGDILAIRGVKRTTTGLVMRDMVQYRVTPLIEALATGRHDEP
ncbi:Lrp/AsnC family transcriptional regulator [Gordonia terrae]